MARTKKTPAPKTIDFDLIANDLVKFAGKNETLTFLHVVEDELQPGVISIVCKNKGGQRLRLDVLASAYMR